MSSVEDLQNASSPGRPPSAPDIDARLDGIAGWLLLPAIGLVLRLLTYYAVLASAWGTAGKIMLMVFGGVFLLTLVTAAEFFLKRAHAPRLCIVLLWVTVVVDALFTAVIAMGLSSGAYVIGQVDGNVVAALAAGYVSGRVVTAVVWTLYFQRSKRVKATFRR